ncbi:MAG TPA: hypothetical protein VFK48_10940 [Usitatibacter sp.]|nr:hypothetical protein [Usitatibacter sp.]
MDLYDFAAQPAIPRDRIYISWNEQWDLHRYADAYLESRGLRRDDEARSRILECIGQYQGWGVLRKADMDYYLDANVKSELAPPQAVQFGKRA